MWSLLICVAISASGVYSSLPYDWKPCKRSDPGYDACLVQGFNKAIESITKGSPELGTPPLTLMTFPLVEFNQGQNFNMTLVESDMRGLDGIRATKIKNDNWKMMTVWAKATGMIRFTGKYKVQGKIITMHVQDEGVYDVKVYENSYKMVFHFETKEIDGKKYHLLKSIDNKLSAKNVVFKFSPKGRDKSFTNLLNKIINDNWRVLFEEHRKSSEEGFIKNLIPIAANIFAKIPAEEYDIP